MLDPEFLESAGDAAEGWLVAASFVDATAVSRGGGVHRRLPQPPRLRARLLARPRRVTTPSTSSSEELVKATKGEQPPKRRELVTLLRKSLLQGHHQGLRLQGGRHVQRLRRVPAPGRGGLVPLPRRGLRQGVAVGGAKSAEHAGVGALKSGDPPSTGQATGCSAGSVRAVWVVVYLARSTGGALAALEGDPRRVRGRPRLPGRFRREAEGGGRAHRAVAGAGRRGGPGAGEPWLATAFVPGPSLAEAVTLHGPLPVRTVRALGARLAEALTGVHAAGLVHRDVKPGNVLLALDGPRADRLRHRAGRRRRRAHRERCGDRFARLSRPSKARAGSQVTSARRAASSRWAAASAGCRGDRPPARSAPSTPAPRVVFRTVHEEPGPGGRAVGPGPAADRLPRQGPGGQRLPRGRCARPRQTGAGRRATGCRLRCPG
ncbi:hypothetical protein ACRAWF_03035 [Streptomyces sp. L7]